MTAQAATYNFWISAVLGVIATALIVGILAFCVLREWRLNRHLMRVQPTTAVEREQAALGFEQQRMVRAQATRIPEVPADLDELEA